MQAKNTPLPDYVLLLEPNWYVKSAIDDLYSLHGRGANFLKLFDILLKYRNHNNGALVFPAVSKIAERLGITQRTAQNYIRKAEDLGYLYIEDCVRLDKDGKPHYKSSRYYITRLIYDPTDESLKHEILDRAHRKSRAAAYRHFGKVLAYLEPRTLLDKPRDTPPPERKCTITIQDSLTADEIIEKPTSQKTVEEPETVILDNILSRQSKRNDAKEILLRYQKRIGAYGMNSHDNFMKKWEEGTFDKEEYIATIETIANDPLMKYTTTSPTRLFFYKDTTLSMREQLLKTIKAHCKWHKDPDVILISLIAVDAVRKWYKPRASNEGGCVKSLMAEIGKALAELSSEVYL